jgi:hypothetical protein
MANIINNVNPLVLDTAGATVSLNTELAIVAIKVIPSAATWSVILHNSAGQIIYQENQYSGNSSGFVLPINTVGLVVNTCTSAKVLVYLAS